MRLDTLLCLFDFCKAIAAIDGAIGLWLEGDFGFVSATGAGGREKFSGSPGGVFAVVAASFAALWFVLEAALCVERLLSRGEHEICATFFTFERFVFVH